MIQKLNTGFYCLALIKGMNITISPVVKAGRAGDGLWIWDGSDRILWLPDANLVERQGVIMRGSLPWGYLNEAADQPEVTDPAGFIANVASLRANAAMMEWADREAALHEGQPANL